jgi:hypothetical protein
MNKADADMVAELLLEHQAVFSKGETDLGRTDFAEHGCHHHHQYD